MNWLEWKYIGIISNRLQSYRRKSQNLVNFKCPFCEVKDNSVSRKARGYIFSKDDRAAFYCHNCNLSYSFANFLKHFDHQSYFDYNLEKMKSEKSPQQIDLEEFTTKMKIPVFIKDTPLTKLKKVSQLSPDHPCKVFVASRKIPNPYHAKMFWCPKFFSWTNDIIPGKFSKSALEYDEGRLLIPFINTFQSMHAFQGRSLDKASKTKYITIINDESSPKIYGLDTVDISKTIYVMEGPIDSMFIPNSLAAAGGDIVSAMRDFPKQNIVVVYDNEPRNSDTVNKIDKAIMNGYKVCIWPKSTDKKDINEMILADMSADYIKHIIDKNTFRDLEAKMAFNDWKKV